MGVVIHGWDYFFVELFFLEYLDIPRDSRKSRESRKSRKSRASRDARAAPPLRHRVVATAAPGMAAQDAASGKIEPAKGTMLTESL